MALTDKQKNILRRGFKISTDAGAGKSFVQILEENLTAAKLSEIVSAVKAELVAQKTASKNALESEITELNK
jgi:hypothetical protein